MKRKGVKAFLAIVILTGVAALLVWAFTEGRKERAMEEEREHPVRAASRVSVVGNETVITLDRPAQARSGIMTTPVKTLTHRGELQAYGTALSIQDLVDLQNGHASALAQLEKARAGLEASGKEYERLKTLHEERNVSDKALQAAEAAWRLDRANEKAAQTAVQSLENSARQRWGETIATWIFGGSSAFERLVAQRDVLLQVTLPSEAYLTSAPQTVTVRTKSGRLAAARFVSPSPATDPRIQGLSYFYLLPAKETGILPGMNVSALLLVGKEVSGALIPSSAAVWWQGRAWGYVQRDESHFVRREISTATPVEEGWFVTGGFSGGERLVTSGAQMLLSEEFRSQIKVGEEE
ncbi:MAG: hypothetical protein M0017_07175 [Desulfobacteraceae bacterium]|nr:hypothetical protein [Desulfobacteraceae bacterium]